jgi:pimeloyl-ACP methyl ester carboxylesterase
MSQLEEPQLDKITTRPGLTFDALTSGEADAPLVLLLHGFAESMNCWRAQMTALAGKGYRAVRRASADIRRARGRMSAYQPITISTI